jgi:hypothetical protein
MLRRGILLCPPGPAAAPLSIRQCHAAREAGVLLTALRFEDEVETMVVKLKRCSSYD